MAKGPIHSRPHRWYLLEDLDCGPAGRFLEMQNEFALELHRAALAGVLRVPIQISSSFPQQQVLVPLACRQLLIRLQELTGIDESFGPFGSIGRRLELDRPHILEPEAEPARPRSEDTQHRFAKRRHGQAIRALDDRRLGLAGALNGAAAAAR